MRDDERPPDDEDPTRLDSQDVQDEGDQPTRRGGETGNETEPGPIYLQASLPIRSEDDAGTLSGRLADAGGGLLVETLERIDAGTLHATEQPEEGVSYAPRLKKTDGRIPWELDVNAVHNHIRGMNPWPGSFTYLGGTYLKILRTEPFDGEDRSEAPGTVVGFGNRGILVACGTGTILVRRLQAEGKRPLDAEEFTKGTVLDVGAALGS